MAYVSLWASTAWDLNITPDLFSLGTGSLGCTRTCRRVLVGWKDVLMPNGARTLLMDSELFFTYEMVT